MDDLDALMEFLRARLDEDGRKIAAMERERTRVTTAPIFQGHPLGWLDGVDIFVNPDRWRAEVQVKRRILDLHGFEEHRGEDGYVYRYCTSCGGGGPHEYPTASPCLTLLALAMPHDEHPDFRAEWRLTSGVD